jgi:hypothetical protein
MLTGKGGTYWHVKKLDSGVPGICEIDVIEMLLRSLARL